AVALFHQRLARLRARIVELTGLADHDGTGADDQDAVDVSTFRHGSALGRSGARRYGAQPRVRLQALDHHVQELLEQVAQVPRAGTCLRMALEAERGAVRALKSLQRTIEQRDVGRANIVRKSRGIYCKSMILAGNKHSAGRDLLDRVIGAVVAK